MSIDRIMNQRRRSSGARCFQRWRANPAYVSLLWSEEESFWDNPFYKRYVPTGRKPSSFGRSIRYAFERFSKPNFSKSHEWGFRVGS